MSTRQNNKKRKARNVINRERTVTTLTEGPESSFLVPTPTEEPGGNIMSGFPLPPSSVPPNMQPGFQIPGDFGPFPYNHPYMGPMGPPGFAPQHQPPPFFHPPPPDSPLGENDLEILENLKRKIKNGQHDLFKAVPNPAFLANLYMGPRKNPGFQVLPHPEQIPMEVERNGPDVAQALADLAPGRNAADTSVGTDATPASQQTVAETRRGDNDVIMRSPASSSLVTSHSNTKDTRSQPVESSVSATSAKPATVGNPERVPQVKHEQDDQFPPLRSEAQGLGRTQSDRSLADEPPLGTRGSIHSSPTKPGYDGKDDQRLSRENSWNYRNGPEDKSRYESDRNGRYNGDSRFNYRDNRGSGFPPRYYDRDRERERSRERERDRDMEYDRERDRRPDLTRFRDDRRNDDRLRNLDSRRLPPDPRSHENRGADSYRSHERRPVDDVSGPPRVRSSDDRPLDIRPPPRNLGEERAIVRGPLDAPPARVPPDDRRPLPASAPDNRLARPPVDDRRAPPAPTDRLARDFEERRPYGQPISSDRTPRSPDGGRPAPPTTGDRETRPDTRRQPSPTNDRQLRPPDDRRLPPATYPDRQARPLDDRRPAPAPATSVDRQVRPQDSLRTPTSVTSNGDRQARPPLDDRRSYPPPSVDRNPRVASDDRRQLPPPAPEDRNGRPTVQPSEERTLRSQLSKEDLSSRPPVLLEGRIGRPAPSLQERISSSTGRPDDGLDRLPPARLDDRLGRSAPTLEERISISRGPAPADDRAARPTPVEDRSARPAMPPPTSMDRATRPGPADGRNMLLAEPARPPVSAQSDRGPRPDERARPTISDRFTRPASPPASADRGRSPRLRAYPSRAQSVAREPPRKFEPRSSTRSPARSDILRPSGDPPPRDRGDTRPPYRPADPGRYGGDRRPDIMDVDTPPARFSASYRRPSPPPPAADSLDAYPPRTRAAWPPASDAYPDDAARRPLTDSRGYEREWREGDRSYPDDWDPRGGRDWERPPAREYERDRFVDAAPAPSNGWETREERERRVSASYPAPADPAPASRSFEPRPLSSRLTDGLTGDDRGYSRDLERARYPPTEANPSTFSRVRPRSPSPIRRSADDLRPPVKRAREDAYGSGYYPPPAAADPPPRSVPPAEYHPPRGRTPPPVSSSAYYDDPHGPPRSPPYRSGPPAPLSRDRDYADPRDRVPEPPGYPTYDRREPPPRMLPPRSPPYGRYGRDERRYSVPPR